MGVAAARLETVDACTRRELMRQRRDRFINNLLSLGGPIVLNGPCGRDRHPGNANLRFGGFSAHDILGALQPHIAASTGSACTSGIPEPSHVLRAIGLTRREADSSIRFSLGLDTTDEDIDHASALIAEVLSILPQVD